jgi:DNA polymerase III epsilon subunit-like protein
MGPNSLDALCRRYGIDNSHRTKHGALLDAELLTDVYIEMLGGRQAALGLSSRPALISDPETGMLSWSKSAKDRRRCRRV